METLVDLVAIIVKGHEGNRQTLHVTVGGGIRKSDLMVEVLEKTLGRRVLRLPVSEGSALGAAVVAAGIIRN